MQSLNRTSTWPVLSPDQVRQLEPTLQAQRENPLMQSAGLACARLAMALAPHAQRLWIAAGPGNNGGDGLQAALYLHQWGKPVVVSLMACPEQSPQDALAALHRAQQAGVRIENHVPGQWLAQMGAQDLCIDALLGVGASRALSPDMWAWVQALQICAAPVLAIDVPTGLNPRSGEWLGYQSGQETAVRVDHTLSLIAVQAGLLMGHGRDASGQIWLEDLGYLPDPHGVPPLAWLNRAHAQPSKPHASHKGSHGDVAVVGGEMDALGMGMGGAAILAATAALHAGAGRVILSWLSGGGAHSNAPPDLMQRDHSQLALHLLTVVCGCGGGQAVQAVLPNVLLHSAQLVLDADGLNALAQDPQLQTLLRQRAPLQATILTPHPLEAARLLQCSTQAVQHDRLKAAQSLADRFQCCVLLKGSGTVIAAPGETPRINTSGNGRLAIGGTGDVLAGLVGARLAQGHSAFSAACSAAAQHGQLANDWPEGHALTASQLAARLA